MTKTLLAFAAAAALIGGTTAGALAQNTTAPGQQMQEKGSVRGTNGASGYAPGQQMQRKGSVRGTTGASGYAPGHTKDTTRGSTTDVDGSRSGTSTGSRRY